MNIFNNFILSFDERFYWWISIKQWPLMPCGKRWTLLVAPSRTQRYATENTKYLDWWNHAVLAWKGDIQPYVVVARSMFAHTIAYVVANIQNIASSADATQMEYDCSALLHRLFQVYGGEYVTVLNKLIKCLTADQFWGCIAMVLCHWSFRYRQIYFNMFLCVHHLPFGPATLIRPFRSVETSLIFGCWGIKKSSGFWIFLWYCFPKIFRPCLMFFAAACDGPLNKRLFIAWPTIS